MGGYKEWHSHGIEILEDEKRLPIIILEPGKAYRREDGSVGQNFYAKEVYDISQTTARDQVQPQVSYDERLLIKGLIASSPVPIRAVGGTAPGPWSHVFCRAERHPGEKGHGRPGHLPLCLPGRSPTCSLPKAWTAIPERQTGIKPMRSAICSAGGMAWDAQEYEISKLDGVFQGQVPREDIPAALADMRDAFKSLNGRMARAMGLTRDSKQKEPER